MSLALSLILTAIAAFLFTEFVGYWLHILLHSDKIPYLSRNHMIHHLKVYGPKKGLRQAGPYKNSVGGRAAVGGLGMEWIAPIALIFAFLLSVFQLIGLPAVHQFVFAVVALGWGKMLFGYMHDAMHVDAFWMNKIPALGRWFKSVRRLHDIHHLQFNDEGRMPANFGICFFWFDRLFGSFQKKARGFNQSGYKTALKRYSFIIN